MAMRGQATTEAALGIMVICTVILFGIHFSEVSILSLKVQEAQASAIWDTTAKRMHLLRSANPDFSPRTTAVGAAGPDATNRYQFFDGRASSNASMPPTLVFTQASPITVTCQEDTGSLPTLNVGAQIGAVFTPAMQGGMSCWASSSFTLVPGFTRNFLQNQPFRVQHSQVNTYPVCGMGRSGGGCQARTVIALGDWGLTDGTEDENCDVTPPGTPCRNTGYYEMTEAAFNANGGGQPGDGRNGKDLSQWLYEGAFGGPAQQVKESAFFMSAVGEDWNPNPFQKENPGAEHPVSYGPYTVTPGGDYDNPALKSYQRAWNTREACAFGLPCDPRTWPSYQ